MGLNGTSGLYQTIAGYMDRAERPYQCLAEDGLMITEIEGAEGPWRVFIQVTDDEELHRVAIHGHLPTRIPACNGQKVAELLTRINYELIIGNFELNLNDGHALFKTSLDLADGKLTRAMFERMYELNARAMKDYSQQIMSVAYDAPTPLKRGQRDQVGC